MEIHSVQDYIDTIEKLKQNYTYAAPIGGNAVFGNQTITPKFIYRGHADHNEYDLVPGIFRWRKISEGYSTTEYSQMEFNVLTDFISEACRFIKDVPSGDIPAWLEIAQHFGVPTRLLDFTQNPLVALYFACSDLRNTQASVWIINEPTYNRIFFGELPIVQASKSQFFVSKIVTDEIVQQDFWQHDNSNYIQYPWIYKPYYREDRMNLQSSIFMLWGADRRKLTDFMQPRFYMTDKDQVENKDTGVICNILIPNSKKHEILEQLNLCGVNEKFIYPGLDGVGRYIKKKYSSKV